MTELNLGENFKLLPGLRYEHTRINYTGYQVLFDDDEEFFSNTPVSGKNSYGQVLPSVHAVYRLTDNSNLRAAFTRTLARPNYSDLAPFQLILVEDNEIELGNPNLDVTTAYNFDVLAEHYFSTVGILSGGFFYKRLNDYIFDFTLREQRTFGGITDFFDVTQPLNGESASLYGFEVALQKQLGFLPAPLDGLGLYFNYTFVDSDTRLPSSDPTLPGRASILPGQAKHVGNLALSYEKFGFSGRASLHYRDRFLSEVASSPTRDIYFDNHMQLDISASQRLNKRLRLFVELNNLTNEPLRRYEGFRNRPVQEEFYSWWGTFGLKIDF